MEYLLFLQELRNGAGSFINDAILFISEFMGGAGAIAVMALVYWCICKRAGRLMLLSFSGAYMMNQSLKNIFCVSRPFILDSRLQPYTSASGYSFPSGHTMLGTSVYMSAAVWQRRRKWFVAICIALTLLTAFGRNWVGVHTPQDVLVGIAVSCGVVAFNCFMLKWLERHPKMDILFLLGGIGWSFVLLMLVPGSEKVCGIYLGALVGWWTERRWIGFRVEGGILRRALLYAGGMGLVLACYKLLLPLIFSPFGSDWEKLLVNYFTFLLVSAGWPAVIALINRRFPAKQPAGIES